MLWDKRTSQKKAGSRNEKTKNYRKTFSEFILKI